MFKYLLNFYEDLHKKELNTSLNDYCSSTISEIIANLPSASIFDEDFLKSLENTTGDKWELKIVKMPEQKAKNFQIEQNGKVSQFVKLEFDEHYVLINKTKKKEYQYQNYFCKVFGKLGNEIYVDGVTKNFTVRDFPLEISANLASNSDTTFVNAYIDYIDRNETKFVSNEPLKKLYQTIAHINASIKECKLLQGEMSYLSYDLHNSAYLHEKPKKSGEVDCEPKVDVIDSLVANYNVMFDKNFKGGILPTFCQGQFQVLEEVDDLLTSMSFGSGMFQCNLEFYLDAYKNFDVEVEFDSDSYIYSKLEYVKTFFENLRFDYDNFQLISKGTDGKDFVIDKDSLNKLVDSGAFDFANDIQCLTDSAISDAHEEHVQYINEQIDFINEKNKTDIPRLDAEDVDYDEVHFGANFYYTGGKTFWFNDADVAIDNKLYYAFHYLWEGIEEIPEKKQEVEEKKEEYEKQLNENKRIAKLIEEDGKVYKIVIDPKEYPQLNKVLQNYNYDAEFVNEQFDSQKIKDFIDRYVLILGEDALRVRKCGHFEHYDALESASGKPHTAYYSYNHNTCLYDSDFSEFNLLIQKINELRAMICNLFGKDNKTQDLVIENIQLLMEELKKYLTQTGKKQEIKPESKLTTGENEMQ